jgi:hypothetical protein
VIDENQVINELLNVDTLLLQFPFANESAWDNKEVGDEIIIDEISTIAFSFLRRKGELFLLKKPDSYFYMPIDYRSPLTFREGDRRWRRDGSSADDMWRVSLSNGNNIQIEGYTWSETGILKFKFCGTIQKDNIWAGEGISGFDYGDKTPQGYKEAFKFKWRMFPKNQQVEDDSTLRKVRIMQKPKPDQFEPDPLEQQTDEERLAEVEFRNRVFKNENMPLVYQFEFRHAKQYPGSKQLEYFASGENGRKKVLYVRDKILPDIDWDDVDSGMNILPNIFFAIDHLASLKEEKKVMDYLLLGLFREEGAIAQNNDLKSWAYIPTLFLLVYYNDWLTPERVTALSNVSNRVRFIVEEVKKYGNDAPNKLDEIMITVLSKLSDNERRDYFVKSFKLRNYVKESNNLSLQKLMPNDLPPPPGPPENMRDWFNRSGKLRRGAFLRLEDDPDRGKVLVLLDADRIELQVMCKHKWRAEV